VVVDAAIIHPVLLETVKEEGITADAVDSWPRVVRLGDFDVVVELYKGFVEAWRRLAGEGTDLGLDAHRAHRTGEDGVLQEASWPGVSGEHPGNFGQRPLRRQSLRDCNVLGLLERKYEWLSEVTCGSQGNALAEFALP